jgi:hypothetical protein
VFTALSILIVTIGSALADEWTCVEYAKTPDQLVHLESQATRGGLLRRDIDCLETGYSSATVMTTKNKISRVLMVNAYARDSTLWSRLALRHLQEVDQSDPNIAFLYAYHLYNRKEGALEDIIEWSEVALERKHEWKGDVHVARVTSLLRLRAIAAADILIKASNEGSTDEMAQNALFESRNRTKTLSREWMDYAKAAGNDFSEAYELCISVASEKACQGDSQKPANPE